MTNVTKVLSTQHFVGITLHGIALKHLPEGAEFRRKTMTPCCALVAFLPQAQGESSSLAV